MLRLTAISTGNGSRLGEKEHEGHAGWRIAISEMVGFGRQAYKGHVFKKHLGVTPESLRKQRPA